MIEALIHPYRHLSVGWISATGSGIVSAELPLQLIARADWPAASSNYVQ